MVPYRGWLGGSSPQEDEVDGPGHDSTMSRWNVRLLLESGSAASTAKTVSLAGIEPAATRNCEDHNVLI